MSNSKKTFITTYLNDGITIAISFILIMSIAFFSIGYFGKNVNLSALFYSAGVGFLVSLITTLVYNKYIIKRNQENIKKSIKEVFEESINIDAIASKTSESIESIVDPLKKIVQDNIFTPDNIFHSNNDGNTEFNKDFTNNLYQSETYIFKGVAGKRVAARKAYNENSNKKQILTSFQQLKMIMPHPDSDLIHEIAAKRNHYRSTSLVEASVLIEEIRKDIRYSIINLYHCAIKYGGDFQIVFQKHNSAPFRCEILENYAYITLYTSLGELRKEEEVVLKFKKHSPLFQFFYHVCHHEFEVCKNMNDYISIQKNTDMKKFNNELKRLKIDPIKPDEQKKAKKVLDNLYKNLEFVVK
ncbi:hypothetical protein [Flagellimonas pacifica]|uniref:Uncharacterized protein n=1 Tax=Flagellimonas pacifica TaxID=1247520 RepID=A0A285MDL9_9FLAO|nr:hypothetical protein [Allomuricauda parva]SNY95284.1 hypothetical protein SAMN06265377_0951 [Allomuricauda parva]